MVIAFQVIRCVTNCFSASKMAKNKVIAIVKSGVQTTDLLVQEIIDDFNNSITSCHHILTYKLGMNRFASKIVLHLQTKYQKDIRISICQKVLDPVNSKAAFIKRVITCADTWVYIFNIERNAQSL